MWCAPRWELSHPPGTLFLCEWAGDVYETYFPLYWLCWEWMRSPMADSPEANLFCVQPGEWPCSMKAGCHHQAKSATQRRALPRLFKATHQNFGPHSKSSHYCFLFWIITDQIKKMRDEIKEEEREAGGASWEALDLVKMSLTSKVMRLPQLSGPPSLLKAFRRLLALEFLIT